MVVVVGGVGIDAVPHLLRHLAPQVVEEFLVSVEGLLFLVGESVVSHVLLVSSRYGEGIGVGCGGWHLSPLGESETVGSVDRHSALVEFLSVAEDVLAHLSEVDVEVASILRGILFPVGVDERVEEPELDILDVGCFEVVGVQLPHHATPLSLRVVKASHGIEFGVEVVGSPFLGIIGEVEHGEGRRGAAVGALVPVGIELADIHLADIMVG